MTIPSRALAVNGKHEIHVMNTYGQLADSTQLWLIILYSEFVDNYFDQLLLTNLANDK